MAVEILREGWIELFIQSRSPNMALSRLFTVKPGGIYRGSKVAIDIERFGEQVAIAIKRFTGPNLNDFDQFTTKEFEPPSYGEAFPLDVNDLINRMAGVDPFTDAYNSYASSLVFQINKGFTLVDDKISRAIELQASQILQTGILNLLNENGETVYEVNFQPKATHFPTVATAWSDTANADPIADMEALGDVIRADGKLDVNIAIMGKDSMRYFLQNQIVQAQLDNRRIEVGRIRPEFQNSGMKYWGMVHIGQYQIELWTYPDTYEDPQTGNPVNYVAPDSCILLSDQTRLDKASAMVPLPVAPDPRVAGFIPDRMSSREDGFDVTPNVYVTPNGKQLTGELESATLLIPVQIDGFGNLDTNP